MIEFEYGWIRCAGEVVLSAEAASIAAQNDSAKFLGAIHAATEVSNHWYYCDLWSSGSKLIDEIKTIPDFWKLCSKQNLQR